VRKKKPAEAGHKVIRFPSSTTAIRPEWPRRVRAPHLGQYLRHSAGAELFKRANAWCLTMADYITHAAERHKLRRASASTLWELDLGIMARRVDNLHTGPNE
jgi:hypothetical protein